MDTISIILIAIGLSMDAFAVSISSCISMKHVKLRDALKLALCFGFFQSAMPYIGWLAASTFSNLISEYDHWIAFVLLSFIGGKMFYGGFGKAEENVCKDATRLHSLLLLGIATSIDALAVGVNFAFTNVDILLPVLYIGTITFAITLAGAYFGKKFGRILGKKAEIIGGLILIGIGIKILIEHLFF